MDIGAVGEEKLRRLNCCYETCRLMQRRVRLYCSLHGHRHRGRGEASPPGSSYRTATKRRQNAAAYWPTHYPLHGRRRRGRGEAFATLTAFFCAVSSSGVLPYLSFAWTSAPWARRTSAILIEFLSAAICSSPNLSFAWTSTSAPWAMRTSSYLDRVKISRHMQWGLTFSFYPFTPSFTRYSFESCL